MIPDCISPIEGATIVWTQAGNINTGAFDTIGEITNRVHKNGGWVHVDGAFGLCAAAAPERAIFVPAWTGRIRGPRTATSG